MNKKILPLIALALLSGPLAAAVLYENPYDPTSIGGGDCSLTTACGFPGTVKVGQQFTLAQASTVQSVSFTVFNQFPNSNAVNVFNWGVYADANGMPTGPAGPMLAGNPTVLPMISGQAWSPANIGVPTFSITPAGGSGNDWASLVNFATGPVSLAAGTYFFAMQGLGSSVTWEGWAQGTSGGGVISNYGVWTPSGFGSYALSVNGTVRAPEVAPSSAIGALTLLFGSLMVLRGRRPARPIG
jgi:hypothetical protein